MNNNGIIIAIGGLKQSGKDTVAKMLNYILRVGPTKANFDKWKNYDIANKEIMAPNIIHFADTLKLSLSNVLNIPMHYFNDTQYKDFLWYGIEEDRFFTEEEVDDRIKINYEDLFSSSNTIKDKSLSAILNKKGKHVIKLRTLMQYYGTVCKSNFYDNIFVIPAIALARYRAKEYNYCIISDLRMKNEELYVHSISKTVVLLIKRDICSKETHESEQCNFTYDYIIENNSTQLLLFYKVIEFAKEIINKFNLNN